MSYRPVDGVVTEARWRPSPNFDARPQSSVVSCVIVHCISLPPGKYGGGQIARFFQNELSADEHPYFADMAHLQVSSHFLVDRSANLTQFVNCNDRAWHAGESVALQQPRVNDFSIGIELEGWDEDPNGFTTRQYQCLASLYLGLQESYPDLSINRLFAHSDIAPGRKPDPGPYFDWNHFFKIIDELSI